MTVWLDRIGTTLLDATLASIAITGLVMLAILHCRQPARRRSWARTGLLASLVVLPLAALNPFPRFDIHAPLHSVFWDSFEASSCSSEPGRSRDNTDPSGIRANAGNDHQDRPPPFSRRLGRVLIVGYLLGLSIGLSWIGLGLWGATLRVRRSFRPSASSIELYDSLISDDARTRPKLLVSRETNRPILLGSFAPVILIPPELDSPGSSEQLRLSLLHELAHVDNLDHRFMPVAHIAEAVWFFLPTFWWIRDQLKLDQEFLADRRAVSRFGSSGYYASSLVELAAKPLSDGQKSPDLAMIQPPLRIPAVASALFQRVEMLLKCPFPIQESTPLWWRWSTTLILTLATVATSCLTIRGIRVWDIPGHFVNEKTAEPFRLDQLVIGQRSDLELIELRYRLPPQFVLTLEVMVEPDEPTLLEILGHRIGPIEISANDRRIDPDWRRVQIRRVQGFDLIDVEGNPVRSVPTTLQASPWLTLRPFNSSPTRIRDLRIE